MKFHRQIIEDNRRWRKEDRHSHNVSLIVTGLVAIAGIISTLIAAGKLPWFK